MNTTIILEEEERQAVLMALAYLCADRPGWDELLSGIAIRIDNTLPNGRPQMYSEFLKIKAEQNTTDKAAIAFSAGICHGLTMRNLNSFEKELLSEAHKILARISGITLSLEPQPKPPKNSERL